MTARRWLGVCLGIASLPVVPAPAESPPTLATEVGSSSPATLTLPFDVDDSQLANPSGYFPAEPAAHHVITRVTLENVGDRAMENPVLRIDGRPHLTLIDPFEYLGLGDPFSPITLYNAWTRQRVHGTTDLDANRHPVEVLRSIGATFCGDDTRSLGRLLATRGIDTRFAEMNGHSVAEYRFGDRWTLFDGDQNAFYLQLDNATPASEADILADPFLVLRTRVYGRQARWSAATAWQNSSRFEFVDPGEQKIYRAKGDPAPTDWTLLPGERLEFDPTRSPQSVIAATANLATNATLVGRSRVATFTVDLAARRAAGIAIRSPLPILAIRSDSGDHSVAVPGEPPIFDVDLPEGVRAVLTCQVAADFIPALRSGDNRLTLTGPGRLRVTFDLDSAAEKLVPVLPPTILADAVFEDGIPGFAVEGPADRLWWQISDDSDFEIVPPNFDTLTDFTSRVRITSPLDHTFLTPGRKHYFRARIRRDGVWSGWSQPLTFMVTKPAQPIIRAVRIVNARQAQIDYAGQEATIRIHGSDRLDFLPEIFTDREPTRIENNRIVEDRPNANFLGEFSGERGFAIVPIRRFYRLVAERDGDRSVPSLLAKLPPAHNLPAAKVLQNRHVKDEGALLGVDLATEQPISGW